MCNATRVSDQSQWTLSSTQIDMNFIDSVIGTKLFEISLRVACFTRGVQYKKCILILVHLPILLYKRCLASMYRQLLLSNVAYKLVRYTFYKQLDKPKHPALFIIIAKQKLQMMYMYMSGWRFAIQTGCRTFIVATAKRRQQWRKKLIHLKEK